MPDGPGRAVVPAAMAVALLGATAVMLSPLTPWTAVLALCGVALLLPAVAVLVIWLLRSW